MLKKIQIKDKSIPIPVPIKTLDQALDWVENTLVCDGQIVTRVTLNKKDISDPSFKSNYEDVELSESSKLEFVIESPKQLALQMLESINKLCSCVHDDLKPIAVECWQVNSSFISNKLEVIQSDIDLSVELIEHLTGLIDPTQVESAAVQGLRLLIIRVSTELKKERKNQDWRRCSRILLNRMEPLLSDLAKEAENLQLQVFASSTSMQSEEAQTGNY